MDDRELIRRAQAGDQAAFAALVEEHNGFLLSLVRQYVGSRDGPDAAQEIWLTVFRKLWQLEAYDAFLPWLRKLTFYQCINYRKARRRYREREVALDTLDWNDLADYLAGGGPGVEELLEQADVRRRVSRLLDELPGVYGLILRLRYMRELSLNEIAGLTGLSLPTVKWRLHEGRRLFKVRLAQSLRKERFGE